LRTYGPGFGSMFTYNWFGSTADTVFTNADGSITINSTTGTGSNAAIASAKVNTGAPLHFNGVAFGGGAYFEAEFRMSPISTQSLGIDTPAWWSFDVEHAIENDAIMNTQWPGQATGYDDWIEPDFLEYNTGSTTKFGSALHNWYGITGSGLQVNGSLGSPITVSVDMSQFHRYGFLWIPATSTSSGTETMYVDGVQVGGTATWALKNYALGGPPATGTQIAAVLDLRHLLIILGNSSNKAQMVVRSVNVWQKTDANNLHQ
jgi:hypothetical protein